MKMILQKTKSLNYIKVLALVCVMFVSNFHVSAQILIQAEDYKNMLGVQTEATSDDGGGINVGWIDTNDWLEYSVNIPVSGDYTISVRVASLSGGGVFNIASGSNSLGNISITATGGWQTWKTISSSNLTFSQGTQTIRFKATTGGFNLNWIEIKLTNPVDANAPSTPVILDNSTGVHDISLCWTSSIDNESVVAGYKIFNGDKFFAFSNDTCFSLSKLAPETSFNLSVYACDLAGNLSAPAQLNIATEAINWNLLWSDEFDGTAVDLTKWKYETGGGGWGNGEAENYTNGANSSVKDGFLIIEVRKEKLGNENYTSSRMNSTTNRDFLYGRIEVRAKLPKTKGTWPAIWTLPTNWVYGGWPDCGEIDIMEHSATYNFGNVFGTIHTAAYNHVDGTQKSGGTTFTDVADAFHTYILEWYPDHLDWYYDDKLIFTFQNEYKTFAEWPYDIKHHLILNVAVGGGLGGAIDAAGVWPQQMVVDYVRVYEFELGEGDTIAPTAPANLKSKPSGVAVELSWTPSTDNKYIEKYFIYKNDELVDSVSGLNCKVIGLDPLTEYTFSVQAKDFGGNLSDKASIKDTTTEVASFAIPGKFQAEGYLYMEGIKTETCTDAGGGLNVAYVSPNDWMEYSIDVASAGKYFLATRVAAQSLKGSFELLDKDKNVLTKAATPATGGWQTWKTVVSNGFNLGAGVQRITFKSLAVDFNLNWFAITNDSAQYATSAETLIGKEIKIFPNPLMGNSLTVELPDYSPSVDISINCMDGKEIYNQKFFNVQSKIGIDNLTLNSGVYIVSITRGNNTIHHKVIAK